MIIMKDVCKWYGDLQVLKNIDLHVEQGEVVVIMGPSGSGKSTLLKVMNGLETVQKGEVIIDGFRIGSKKTNLTKLRADIGMVFQHFNLYTHMNVIDNIILAPIKVRKLSRKQAVKKASALLEKVGLYDKGDCYPCELSGGEQQRVAIARSLAMEPKMMLFDEPTSALDPELINEVLDVIINLALEGMTMVVVTHEMGFARRVADREIFLDRGEIIESGKPYELLVDPKNERTRRFMSKILHERSTLHFVKKSGIVRIGVGYDCPPFDFIDENGNFAGFDIELAAEIAKRLGCTPEFVKVKKNDRINYIVSNKIDMCVSKLNHTKTRDRIIDFSESYLKNLKRIVSHRGRFKRMHELSNRRVSVASGTSTSSEIGICFKNRGYEQPLFVEYESEEAAFDALRLGLVDGYSSDEIILSLFLTKDSGKEKYEMIDEACCYSYFCVGVPENDSEWLNDINNLLQEIWKDGVYEKLFIKWFGNGMSRYMRQIEIWAE